MITIQKAEVFPPLFYFQLFDKKHGFEKKENYNKGKDGHRVPNCPPEKEKAIEDAFKRFRML